MLRSASQGCCFPQIATLYWLWILSHNSLIKRGNSHCALSVNLKLITPATLICSRIVSCVLFFQQYWKFEYYKLCDCSVIINSPDSLVCLEEPSKQLIALPAISFPSDIPLYWISHHQRVQLGCIPAWNFMTTFCFHSSLYLYPVSLSVLQKFFSGFSFLCFSNNLFMNVVCQFCGCSVLKVAIYLEVWQEAEN